MDDVQTQLISSWWEIPCIAHFCSLFRLYFDLIDFDIEELEEALLTDSVEEVASCLLQDLIVQLLKGCFNSQQDDITTSNYQMYLRRLFRKKCEEGSTKDNPFESDAAFHSLPLRTKVKILYDLCDFRLDNEDVPESLKSLESDSLRVEPLGRDSGGSTYWYFYGTRLYREDYGSEKQGGAQKRARKELHYGEKGCTKWQVVCYTEEDWQLLTRKFKNCKSLHEKNLHRTLSADFLPELPRLFAEKERLQRKRMLEQQLRRSGRTILSEPNHREEMPVPSHKKSSSNPNSTNSSKHISSESEDGRGSDMEEDELRRQREEQEKADRLLAEEIEREERKARLHLRERRGGGGGAIIPPTPTHEKSSRSGSSSKKVGGGGGGSRSSSATSKSPSKSPIKKKGKEKRKKKLGSARTTNNSLASSIQSAALSKGASKDDEDEDKEESDGEDEELDCDDKDDDEERFSDQDEDDRSQSPASSTSASPVKKSAKKSSVKPKKKNTEASLDKEKRSKSKDKLRDKEKDRDRKRKKLKKEKSKDKERGDKDKDGKVKTKQIGKSSKEKSSHDTNHVSAPTHHSMSGMSKAKVKSSVLFSQSDEDVQIGMHKVIESIKNHGDAWPFMNPVDEDYAPNYYRVISSPMDVQTMEDKLDNQEYISLEEFIADFQRIVDNCIKYNGPSSEYTEMAETLQEAFNKLIQRYIVPDESDEEISIEYNNVGVEKKKSRPHTHSKKEDHKKEKEYSNEKIKPPKSSTIKSKPNKSSTEKRSKVDKKSKNKLMRHHSRDSEAIENLDSATAETLKDIDKWLDYDGMPKPTEFVSSGAAAFDNLRNRILEDDNNDRDTIKHNNNNTTKHSDSSGSPGHKRKGEEITKVRPTYISKVKPNPKKRDYDDEGDDEDFTPPKKMPKKSDKHSTKSDKSKPEKTKQNKKSSDLLKSKKNLKQQEKRSGGKAKDKDKKTNPSNISSKHRHNSDDDSDHDDNFGKKIKHDSGNVLSPKFNGPVSSKGKKKSYGDVPSKDEYFPQDSPTDDSPTGEKPMLKHAKSLESKKQNKTPKRSNSLFNTMKSSGSIKKLQQVNKNTKVNSAEAKFNKLANSLDTFTPGESLEKVVGSLGRENSSGGDKPEKKKCLLLNDNTTDRVGAPKLSLGSLLSTDAIKIGEFKKNESPEEVDVISSKPRKVETHPQESGDGDKLNSKKEVKDSIDSEDKDPSKPEVEEEEEETDRKLEPSKGFKPEKCMPNLSAWIKAFGGPTKPAPSGGPDAGSMPNSHHGRKVDNDPKSFKVMGRGVADSGSINDSKSSHHHPQPHKHSPVPKAIGKHGAHHNIPPPPSHHNEPPHWNSSAPASSSHKPGDHSHPQVINLSEEISSSNNHSHSGVQHKKHRHRKMSTSSLSSQSESGSPHCFNNTEGGHPGGIGSVVIPPRWVDEAWTHSHSHQSQSPASQVSSQSPANSPFSPVINSPPHTPQTPPRLPVGPVRVGFYQDLTSQHSSPEKINEPHSNSNSNVASPSTPPTPTTNNKNSSSAPRGRDSSSGGGSKGFGGGSYSTPIYAPRYAASTPSPNVGGSGSNMQSPSPGGMGNSVESPPGNPNSPHSPTVPEYRSQSYNSNQQQHGSSSSGNGRSSTAAPSSSLPTATPAHSHHRPSSLSHGSHSPSAPSIPPYPPPNNHHPYHGHPSAGQHPEAAHSNPSISQAHAHQHQQPQPVMAHMNHQVQAHSQMSHQQHYDRYPPHNYHHQMNHAPSSSGQSSSLPSSSVYSQNLTAAHSHQRPSTAQPSPYPTNPYASNPRSINIPPNVYNNPMTSDPTAMSRFYKTTSVGGGELSLTPTTSDQHPSSSTPTSSSSSSTSSTSRGRSSRSSAVASEQQEMMQSRAANLEGKLGHPDLGNGFQWPHNLASLSQIVNSIPNPMNAVGMANAYRQYDQAMAESMSKYQQQQQRSDPTGYGAVSGSGGSGAKGGTPGLNPPAAHSQPADKLPSDSDSGSGGGVSNSRTRTKGESKSSSRSSKSGSQSMVPGSAFNFSSLSSADLAIYPTKEMSDGSLYSASPPSLVHRAEIYPVSTSSFHASFSSSSRGTTAGGVPTPSISPYQISPFIGSHPSPYQPQSSQPFAHTQPPRGLVDPYQQFFQSSPHVMGLLPPTGYPYPHGLGFNRPGWI